MAEASWSERVLDEVTQTIAKSWQDDDGGWPSSHHQRNQGSHSDIWSTAQALLWLISYDTPKYRKEIDHGISYILLNQHTTPIVSADQADHGWGWRLDRPSDVAGTAHACLALTRYVKDALGGRPTADLVRAISQGRDWLVKHRNPDAGWSCLQQPNSTAFATCWATLALQECLDIPGLMIPEIKSVIVPGAIGLIEARMRESGWGDVLGEQPDALGTSYAAHFLHIVNRDAASFGRNWLRSHQADDGSWEPGPAQSVVEATAWALHVLLEGNADPESYRVSAAVAFLKSLYMRGMGWSDVPNGQPQLWATYYVCLTLFEYLRAVRRGASPSLSTSSEGKGFYSEGRRLGHKVFIVHGHHPELRNRAKEAVESIGFEGIILQEQPEIGAMTITEKFEHYATQDGVDFALVLATADDLEQGGVHERRNVDAELGYFTAKLGRRRVIVCADKNVVLPSDFGSIVTIDLRAVDWLEQVKRALTEAEKAP